MPNLSLLLVVIFIALTAWSAWKSCRSTKSAATQLFNLAVTLAVNAVIGILTPWYASVHITWWYLLVAATAAHAAATAFNLGRRRQTRGAE
ncbi:hypothetical protein KJY77_03990 [Canibacter sp. lx-72]|uniref:hypothetical protein n=1 Tax=Canibacter zhuwentaonis TaxID=2837491 RepID=UPI001BDD307E|nr:hypothetical protein [Canibacter zhuwentaonis]MBT1018299.1 hypothetical protein [Canibacter zhuwentaonis]